MPVYTRVAYRTAKGVYLSKEHIAGVADAWSRRGSLSGRVQLVDDRATYTWRCHVDVSLWLFPNSARYKYTI
jgi:hypothetical protein